MTPTNTVLLTNAFYKTEHERTYHEPLIYYVYEGNDFTGIHVNQATIELTETTQVFQCNKIARKSKRIF